MKFLKCILLKWFPYEALLRFDIKKIYRNLCYLPVCSVHRSKNISANICFNISIKSKLKENSAVFLFLVIKSNFAPPSTRPPNLNRIAQIPSKKKKTWKTSIKKRCVSIISEWCDMTTTALPWPYTLQAHHINISHHLALVPHEFLIGNLCVHSLPPFFLFFYFYLHAFVAALLRGRR